VKIAIVHDFLNQYGGAERVVEALHEVYPDAPIYTSIYVQKNLPDIFKTMNIKTSYMQKLPFLKHFKKYLLLYPSAFETFDLSKYDVVLSSSSAFAKGVKISNSTCHVCYCYTPMRFAWNYGNYIGKENIGKLAKKCLPYFLKYLKLWDVKTSKKVDYFIAISCEIQKRIKACYSRESDLIYPPVNTRDFSVSSHVGDYFLVVSRLNGYKRIDLVVNAFNELKLKLKIIGDGPCRNSLEQIAGHNIEFLGKVDEISLRNNYAHCRAIIFPGEEDFGIVPLEAQSSGRPVIAFAAGGALETVIDGRTGIFFNTQSVESLIDAINRFLKLENTFDSSQIRANVIQYDKEIFKKAIFNYVNVKYEEFKKRT